MTADNELQQLLDGLAELPEFERNEFYLVYGDEITRLKEFDRTGKDPNADVRDPATIASERAHPHYGKSCIEAENRAMERAREGKHYQVGDWRTDAKTQRELDADIAARVSARYSGVSLRQYLAAGENILRESGEKFAFDTDASRDAFADAVAARAGGKLKQGAASDVYTQGGADNDDTPTAAERDAQANREWMQELSEARSAAGLR